MLADEQREVSVMEEGNIAVAVGMKNVSWGFRICTYIHVDLSMIIILLFSLLGCHTCNVC